MTRRYWHLVENMKKSSRVPKWFHSCVDGAFGFAWGTSFSKILKVTARVIERADLAGTLGACSGNAILHH